MKPSIFLTGLRKRVLLSLLILTVTPSLSCVALAEPSNSVKKINKTKHIKPWRKATKLEVIAAVKSRYKGRILSIRKKPNYYGLNCHYVKMIDKKGEFLTIHVACKN